MLEHKTITNVDEYIETLKDHLTTILPPIKTKPGEKLIRLSILWRETLLHRIVDLASVAKDMFKDGRLVPGCTLTRSLYETVAMEYYLFTKVQTAIDKRSTDEIHKIVISGFFGSRDGSSRENSLQVLTAIDHIDKKYDCIRSEYDHLCEYAHPNMKGGFGTYTKIDIPSMSVEFGQNPQKIPIVAFGLGALEIILIVAIDVHKELLQVEDTFSKLIYDLAPGKYKD